MFRSPCRSVAVTWDNFANFNDDVILYDTLSVDELALYNEMFTSLLINSFMLSTLPISHYTTKQPQTELNK